MQQKGKYENDYYTILSAKTVDGDKIYSIHWLTSGSIDSGYSLPTLARRRADAIVARCLADPNLDAANL